MPAIKETSKPPPLAQPQSSRRASLSRLRTDLLSIAYSPCCRNYKAHALELKNAVPKEPFFFLKPTTSYVQDGGLVEIPTGVEVHHESESALCSPALALVHAGVSEADGLRLVG